MPDRWFVFVLRDCCFLFSCLLFEILEEALLNYSFESQNVHALPLTATKKGDKQSEREGEGDRGRKRQLKRHKMRETITRSYSISSVVSFTQLQLVNL